MKISPKYFFKLLFVILLSLLLFGNIVSADLDLLRINFIDVGQADCILIQTPNAKNMLIDAGNNEDFITISNFLKMNGVKNLDVVIGTHPHEDHIGSMDEIIKGFNIGKVFMPRVSTTTRTFEDLLLAIKKKGLKIITAYAGINFDLDSNLKLKFLAPNNDKYENLNDYSAVIKLTYNKNSFLFVGDAGIVSEEEMLRKGYDLKADVLKIGHHGSSSSTSDAFLRQVSPTYAVISVGSDNPYGHPSKETLNRLLNADIKIYRTDLDGTVIVTSDGQTIKINKNASPIKSNGPPVNLTSVNSSNLDQPIETSLTVYITRTGHKYHRAGCRYLGRSCIPIDLKEAKSMGYGPCSVCNPPQ